MQLSALAQWVESGTSVNCMKFIMVSFLGLSVTTEASGAYMNWVNAAQLIALGTLVGGVAVVLALLSFMNTSKRAKHMH